MLVLGRKAGEQIVVPICGLTVTILRIQGSRVRLGISAPTQVTVVRGELTLGMRSTSRPERPTTGKPSATGNEEKQ
jgi:carbon storage regulator